MSKGTIDRLIINSPYEEPKQHWKYNRESRTFSLVEGRRAAGYVVATPNAKAFDDPGVFIEIPVVNKIRVRVKEWRESGYPGVTGITKQLLEHWHNLEERSYRRFFYCQLEAIETLIWMCEAPGSQSTGIELTPDGGEFTRLCSKMATGSGKTIVMAMLIAWQTLNKVTYLQDNRFSKNILIIAPGLTVKSRLQVLIPAGNQNYFDEFNIVPAGLIEKLRQGKVLIHNWHALAWETEKKLAKRKTVDKRGAKSDEAYTREVLGEMASANNLLVVNDEAHHAWRVPSESKIAGVKKEEIDEATIWMQGLDRIHRSRGILTCYDFSATPFAPSGKKSSEEALFTWIVSDFGLNDAIESGLVKTPRVVIRDDGTLDSKTYRSKFYHIYEHVKDELNQKAEPKTPLPMLVNNAFYFLGRDWLETAKKWKEKGESVPPVMITVANLTETAARVKYAFDSNRFHIDELRAPEKTLHIDSKVLADAESQDEAEQIEMGVADEADEQQVDEPIRKLTKKQWAEQERQKVNTVGQPGKPGEQIQAVISVGMLSEGWDAKTVTHIMGLRAFSSQLLCEQVVGRGLRRTTYEIDESTGLFRAEYVNIFGVPFTFLPYEATDETEVKIDSAPTRIEPTESKKEFEISWPNIDRIEHTYTPELKLEITKVPAIHLDAYKTAMITDLAPVVEGKPDFTKITEISLKELAKKMRMQKIMFDTAARLYDTMKPDEWKGNREFLLAQIIRIIEQFLNSNKIKIDPPLFIQHEDKKRIMLTLHMDRIVQHIFELIRFNNTESIEPVFNKEHPIRSTGDMRTWYSRRPTEFTKRSHINFCVLDSTWEASEMYELDRNNHVKAWVKNDHLGFEIRYIFEGEPKKYRPDFLIRFNNGEMFVLECKGMDSQQDRTKRKFLDEWVNAVNVQGGFGKWQWAVSKHPKDVEGLIEKAMNASKG